MRKKLENVSHFKYCTKIMLQVASTWLQRAILFRNVSSTRLVQSAAQYSQKRNYSLVESFIFFSIRFRYRSVQLIVLKAFGASHATCNLIQPTIFFIFISCGASCRSSFYSVVEFVVSPKPIIFENVFESCALIEFALCEIHDEFLTRVSFYF